MPQDSYDESEPPFPNDSQAPDWDTLAAYFTGELRGAAAERLREWMNADPARRAGVEQLRNVWSRAAEQPLDDEVDVLWSKLAVKAGLAAPTHAKPHRVLSIVGRQRRPLWRRAWWMPLAAAAAVALYVVPPRQNARRAEPVAERAFREYTTTNAQRAELRLADGSRVVLAPASRLTVPDNFGATGRTVTLEGQGYFDVVHDDTKPFVVRSPNTLTRDIGTAFAITDYAGDRVARVLVAEGEVALLGARDTAQSAVQYLRPGDMARVTESGQISRTSGVDVRRKLTWLRGGLEFDDVPLVDAVREIGRWHDLDIRLGDPSLERLRLVAMIDDGPADGVLRLVALTLDLRYDKEGRTVTLYPNRGRK